MTSQATVTDAGDGVLQVSGPLDLSTVVGLREQAEPKLARALRAGETLVIDLAAVGRTDSSGLALLVHWMRVARGRGAGIAFRALPAQLLAIARTSRLESRLPRAEVGSADG